MNNIKEFCEYHRIRIVDTNKRSHVRYKVNMQYFKDPLDYNKLYEDGIMKTEPLYTVEITESELQRIAEFESQVFNNMKQNGHYNLFEHLMEQKEQEKVLKEKYPAVKKAYENYSLMLKLAQSGEL